LFTLAPGEGTTVGILFSGLRAGISTGLITIATDFAQQKIPVVITVHSPGAMFSLDFVVPPPFKAIRHGGEIFSTLTLAHLQGGYVDVQYVIMNAANTPVFKETHVVKVANELILEKTILVPASLREGSYAFGVVVNYKGETKSATTLFSVQHSPPSEPVYEEPAPSGNLRGVVLIVLLLCLFLLHFLMNKKARSRATL